MMNSLNFVVSHKNFNDPRFKERTILFVNQSVPKNITNNNEVKSWTGDNIDNLNYCYCELTALYWIWKNVSEDCIISFEHYRRVFASPKSSWFKYSFLMPNEANAILEKYKIILPQKHHFKDTLFDQYAKNHVIGDLLCMKKVILSQHPDYAKNYDSFMNGHEAVLFNMFIAEKRIIDSYCAFAFPILDEIFKEKHEDIISRDNYQKRAIGFLAERLFNIWINHNFDQGEAFHCPVAHLDQKPLMHYLKDFYFKTRRKDYDEKRSKL